MFLMFVSCQSAEKGNRKFVCWCALCVRVPSHSRDWRHGQNEKANKKMRRALPVATRSCQLPWAVGFLRVPPNASLGSKVPTQQNYEATWRRIGGLVGCPIKHQYLIANVVPLVWEKCRRDSRSPRRSRRPQELIPTKCAEMEQRRSFTMQNSTDSAIRKDGTTKRFLRCEACEWHFNSHELPSK